MNYNITVCGHNSETFDSLIKLLYETIKAADYLIEIHPHKHESPFSNVGVDILIRGSSKPDIIDVVLDMDKVYNNDALENKVAINPIVLGISFSENRSHYWGVIGSLFKIVTDLSPAFITGFLLEKKYNDELTLFKQYISASLPLKVQELLGENA